MPEQNVDVMGGYAHLGKYRGQAFAYTVQALRNAGVIAPPREQVAERLLRSRPPVDRNQERLALRHVLARRGVTAKLVPKTAVERLGEGGLHRLSRREVVPVDPRLLTPSEYSYTTAFRTMIALGPEHKAILWVSPIRPKNVERSQGLV